MSRAELEDELEYNISRKEKLKEDVINLERENERINQKIENILRNLSPLEQLLMT